MLISPIMKNYLKMLRFLEHRKGQFAFALVFMFLASVFEAFQLSLAMPVIDIIFMKGDITIPTNLPEFAQNGLNWINDLDPKTVFIGFPFVMLGGVLIKQFFIFIHKYLMNDISQKTLLDVRSKLFNKIQGLSLDYFSEQRTGELVSRITFDVNLIEHAISYALTDLFKQSFLIGLYLFIAFTIFPEGAIILFCVMPLVALPLGNLGKMLRKLSSRSQEKNGRY